MEVAEIDGHEPAVRGLGCKLELLAGIPDGDDRIVAVEVPGVDLQFAELELAGVPDDGDRLFALLQRLADEDRIGRVVDTGRHLDLAHCAQEALRHPGAHRGDLEGLREAAGHDSISSDGVGVCGDFLDMDVVIVGQRAADMRDIVEVVPCIGPGVAVSCRRRGGIARGRVPGQDMGLQARSVAAAPVVMEGLRHAAADEFSAPALYRDSVQTHVWGRRRIREGRH